MKNFINLVIYILCSVFVMLLYMGLTEIPGLARTLTEKEKDIQSISDTSKGIAGLEEKRAEITERMQKIKTSRKDVLSYIEKLDKELGELEKDMEDISGDIEKETGEYEEQLKRLREIDREQRSQYDTMKTRIKYMYENGNREYLELLLSSGSFSELMNRTEYISKIAQYDNSLFDTYCDLKEEALIKRENVNGRLEKLNELKKTKEFEQTALNELRKGKKKELAAYKEQIGKTKEELIKYNEEIEEQEKLLEQLLKQERERVEEEQKRLEEERKKNGEEEEEEKEGEKDSELFSWPLGEKGIITGGFGYRDIPIAGASSYHNGLDIGVVQGTPILAAASGTVVVSRYSPTAGNFVMIYHGGSTYSVYMHASELAVKEGEIVYQGQVIAFVGTTGLSTGPHLHFGINVDNEYVDPLGYVTQP